MNKICCTCYQEKDLSLFRKDKRQHFGYSGKCKDCVNQYMTDYRKTDKSIKQRQTYFQQNKDKLRSKKDKKKEKLWILKHRYNISEEVYNQLLKEQNYSCAICKKHQSLFKKSLHIDHCHQTGKVRGLLCCQCNPGLGSFKDNIELLHEAIKYLTK